MAALFPNLRTLPPRPPTNRESSPSQPPVSALTLSPDPASVDAIIVPSASQARPLISAGSPGDFSNRNLLSEGEEHDLKALIESKNIRPLPYPFGSGVAVVTPVRRRPKWVLLGVALVALAMLLGAWVFATNSHSTAVLVATSPRTARRRT